MGNKIPPLVCNQKLAIVIPYFKIDHFEKTLQSLAGQKDKRFNVYIGDDASQNLPEQLIELYSNEVKIQYLRFKTNLGATSLTSHWARCLELVQNESWVLMLGDDDTLDSYCILEFYKNLDKIHNNKINVVRFASRIIDEREEVISKKYKHPELEKVTDFFVRKAKGTTRSSLSEYIFRKKTLLDKGFQDFPLAWHSDDALLFEISNFGMIYTINEATVNFRHSTKNLTQKRDNLKEKAFASWSYYRFLMERLEYFSKSEKKLVYEHYERAFLNNKRNWGAWSFTFQHYIKHFRLIRLYNLLIRAIENLISNYRKNNH
ncbi:glycosyltransferase family 2 protein [Christiangramia marina]|uniref:glycosyltransferase family 2 protein n=1 Tax=Christiangramia marina TaxID=409436 RepID=UPI003AA8F8A0